MKRTLWLELPPQARCAVEEYTGRITGEETAEAGVMSAFASALHTRSGRVFVKGTPTDSPTAWVYRHEAAITPFAPLAPALLWQVEAGGWHLTGYQFIHGRHPDFAPGSNDLTLLIDALWVMSEVSWPASVDKKPLAHRLAAHLPDPEAEKALAGTALVHTDAGEFNLIGTTGGVRIIDWALSCPGPDWADAASTIPRLIRAGHSPLQAQRLMGLVPAYRQADPDHIAVFARALHAFWVQLAGPAPDAYRRDYIDAAGVWVDSLS